MKLDSVPDHYTFSSVFEGIDDAVISHDLKGNILTCNPAVRAILGYDPATLPGQSIFRMIPPDYQHEHEELLRHIVNKKDITRVRTLRRAADGEMMPVALTIIPVKDSHDNIVGACQVFRKISRELETEIELNRLGAILEGCEDAIIGRTLDGIITSWNPGAERIFGYTAKEAIGKPINLIVPNDRLAEHDMILTRIRNGGKVKNFETIRQSKNGDPVPISLTVSPISDKAGNVLGVSTIARNISARRLAEERGASLAAVIESSEDAIISKTLEGIITGWNKSAERIFGYSEHEVMGKHISLIVPAERLSEINHIFQKIRKGIKIDHYSTIRKTKAGKLVPISLTVTPVRDSTGNIIGATKISRDITREQAGHEALKQYAERLQILNTMAKTIAEKLNVQDILQKVTDAATQLVGAAFGAFFYNVIDQHGESYMLYTLSGAPREAFDKFGMPRNTAVFHPTFSGESVVRVDDIKKDSRYGKMAPHFGMPKGHLSVTSYLAVPVFSGDGSVIGGLFFGHPEPGMFTPEHEDLVVSMASHAGIALDNSQLFEKVSDLSKKKDEFIALATHELKTPLTSLNGFLQLAHSRLQHDKMNQSFVGKGISQLKRLTALINDLFDVSKIQAGKMQFEYEDIDMTEVASDLVETLEQTGIHNIILSYKEPVPLKADRMRVEQVLANFVNNAVKYSPNGGKIEILIEDLRHEICVSVKDEGIGIDQENLKNIFSQFYRAPGLSKNISGLGLGLYISKEIIERHGGTVHVKSEEGRGSTFTFCLPKLPQ